MREGKQRKQIHLAAHFPGVNNTTVWSDPDSGSQLDFSSFVHLAETAERGLFDFFFLAEGLRLREHRGRIHDLDVVGRPDTFTVLAALAAVTDRLGLVGTVNTTFNEPFEVARQFATLDHLSDGRAGWNMVTSSDAFTGANFRRGGYLQYADRYVRAEEFITVARQFWDSWDADAVPADDASGQYVDPERVRAVEFHGAQFDVRGLATLPAGPQGHPILLQAGDSSDGRDFGAKHADALFTLHSELAAGQKYYADVKARAVANRTTASRSFRRRRSCSGTPLPRPPTGPGTSAVSRSPVPPPSRWPNRCGSATFPATTPTDRCPTSNHSTIPPSRRGGCATATPRPSPPHGASVRSRRA